MRQDEHADRRPEAGPSPLVCAITGKAAHRRDLMRLDQLRPALAERIIAGHPGLAADALVSRAALDSYRRSFVEELLREEHGELGELERAVADSIAKQDTIAANVEAEFERRRSAGEKLSDGMASFGSSWAFLIAFFTVLVVWIAVNVAVGERAFDAYPFILLNLVLSCLAAVQAPVIMMSQRRTEQKDRLRALNDYRVNLKAELEIRHLHDKLDHLLGRQFERLAEIQRLQLDLLEMRK